MDLMEIWVSFIGYSAGIIWRR